MYGSDKRTHPPPFGHPRAQCPPYILRGSGGVAHPGHSPTAPFSASRSESDYLLNRPPTGHLNSVRTQHMNPAGLAAQPHCSSFSIDRSTVIALGGSQQIIPHAEPSHFQVSPWNSTPVQHHLSDNSDRAGEEFLRCIAANKPFPDYLKGDMVYNLVDAFKSANALKAAIKSNPDIQKHVTRSRSRSYGRNREKSRAKSRPRSRSRGSRGRSKSRICGKSRANSRARSKSRARSRNNRKSHLRSKSLVRRSKSRSSSFEKSCAKDKKRKIGPSSSSSVSNSNDLRGKSLLDGLKLVMNSKELEERLPSLKDAILTIKASDESKKEQCVPDEQRHEKHNSEGNSESLENDSMLLPHERVGSDFSWLQSQSQEVSIGQKGDGHEDEESFLYGDEANGGKQDNSSTILFPEFSKSQELRQELDVSAVSSQQYLQNKSLLTRFGDVLVSEQPLPMCSSLSLDISEYEKITNIIKGQGMADVSKIMVNVPGQKSEKPLSPASHGSDPAAVILAMPALKNPNVQQALESLQSLIKATKEKREKCDGSGTSQTSDKLKASDNEERQREKQAKISKIEFLMKELDGLMKQDGLSFLTPVIGFYCQKCEEFIGDLSSAESHAAMHQHNSYSIQKVPMNKDAGQSAEDCKGHSHSLSTSSSNQQPHPSVRRDQWDCSCHSSSGDHRYKNHHQDWRNESDIRNHKEIQENISLREEMSRERMLITVSRALSPPHYVGVKEELNKEQNISGYSKVKVENANKKVSRNNECSDSSDNNKGKTPKKIKEEKRKKKKKKKRGE